MKQSILLTWMKIGLYALPFTSLIFWKRLDYFFDSTKSFFVMGLSELLFVGFFWLIHAHPQFRPRWNAVSIAFVLYLAVVVFVSLIGVDPFLSFWASTDRINGVLFLLHLGGIFFVLSSVLRTQEDWNIFFLVNSMIALLVCFVFFLSFLDPSFFSYSKAGSTLGNSTYLGAYLLFSIFFSALLAVTGRSSNVRKYGFITAIFFALTIFFTSALAAKGALMGGAVLALGLFLISSPKRTKKKRNIGWAILLVLVALFIFVSISVFFPDSFVQKAFIKASSAARLVVWQIAWRAFLDRPIFGWGLENFQTAFANHFIPCFGSKVCGTEVWYDRAHNNVLDLLVDGGVILLFAYLSLLYAGVWQIWKTQMSKYTAPVVAVLFTTFITALFVHNLVEFDVTITLLFFVVVLSFASASVSFVHKDQVEPVSIGPTHKQKFYLFIAVIITLLSPLVFYYAVVSPWLTNQTIRVVQAKTMIERSPEYEKMIDGSPVGIDFRRVFLAGETAKLVFGGNMARREKLSEPIRREIDLAINGLEQTINRAPNYVRGFDLATLLYQMKARYYNDPDALVRAETIARRSLALNSRNQQAYWALSAILIEQNREEEAFALLETAIRLDPDVPDSYIKKLAAFKLIGREEEFSALEAEVVRRFPLRKAQISDLASVKPTDGKDWLYTVFY
ncbi:O-antigen ligase family protein [Candidatus Uhrbacteria bacterium]|nr:O-antigen ligase family protein [Candidatus Uhrbacteria bacterium]